jgi:glycerol kinase
MQLQPTSSESLVVRPAVARPPRWRSKPPARHIGAYASLAELSSLWREDRTFEPEWSAARREESYRGWTRAVDRSRGWIEA